MNPQLLKSSSSKKTEKKLWNPESLLKKKDRNPSIPLKEAILKKEQDFQEKMMQNSFKLKKFSSLSTNTGSFLFDENERNILSKFNSDPRFKARVEQYVKMQTQKKSKKQEREDEDSDVQGPFNTDFRTLSGERKSKKQKQAELFEKCVELIERFSLK